METFFALLALCVGNSPVPGEFPSQRPVTRSFDVFFELFIEQTIVMLVFWDAIAPIYDVIVMSYTILRTMKR